MSQRLHSIYTKPLALLEIGTSKTTCWIIAAQENKTFHIQGTAHQETCGYVRGRVIDLDALSKRIARIVEEAENNAQTRIKSVALTLGGPFLQEKIHKSESNLLGAYVTQADLQRLQQAARLHAEPTTNHVLHIINQDYTLDDQPGIENPKGMIGKTLKGTFQIIFIPHLFLQNLLMAIKKIHLDVFYIAATPYLTGRTLLSRDDQSLGAVLLDCGAGSTSLSTFKHNKLLSFDSIPLGGKHITRDLAYGLDVDLDAAERIKILQGTCLRGLYNTQSNVAYMKPALIHTQTTSFTDERLVDIIAPRVEEIVRCAHKVLKEHEKKRGFLQRVILTGGSSQLIGFKEAATHIFGKQVRISGEPAPQGLHGSVLEFSALTSLLQEINSLKEQDFLSFQPTIPSGQRFFNHILSWFRDNL